VSWLDEEIAKLRDRGNYEWDQSNDPLMINKSVACPTSTMSGSLCADLHFDGWGQAHYCERAKGHTGRHYACNWRCDYIVAVWK
jgi:hypothetical protein